MPATNIYQKMAGMIAASDRRTILEEGWIDKAVNNDTVNTPMEFLFDVYMNFIPGGQQFDDWNCYKCREHVLKDWKEMKPFLLEIESN